MRQERVSLTVPGDLKRKARAKAIAEGTTLSELVRGWLAEFITLERCEGCGQEFHRDTLEQDARGRWYCGDDYYLGEWPKPKKEADK